MDALFKRLPRDEFEKEYRKRRRAELKQRRADGALILDMLDAGRRSVVLAKKLHPDHGGSTEAMMRLNQLHEQISHQVKVQFGIKKR